MYNGEVTIIIYVKFVNPKPNPNPKPIPNPNPKP